MQKFIIKTLDLITKRNTFECRRFGVSVANKQRNLDKNGVLCRKRLQKADTANVSCKHYGMQKTLNRCTDVFCCQNNNMAISKKQPKMAYVIGVSDETKRFQKK